MPARPYPTWKFYPVRLPAPKWAPGVLKTFTTARSKIDSAELRGVSSDTALAAVRPGLRKLGFTVEHGKTTADKIWRPVLFGENGEPVVAYEVDGFHQRERIVLEVEAGRGAANNADYRDLVRASLMVDTDYLVLAMMQEYRAGKQVTRSYEQTRKRLDAVYASDRLKLPLKGVLLIGY
ncbi:MAG: hypothetical protein ACRDM0_07040 [Thermoleophilaceae bacterium]